MRILVTGYGSFGDIAVNPSAVVVNELEQDKEDSNSRISHANGSLGASAERQQHHVELVTRVVEVCYADALNCSNWARNELNVDFAIHIGVYPGSGCIFLERRAFRNGYISKDVHGSVPLQNCCELLSDQQGCPPTGATDQQPSDQCCRYTVLDLDRLTTTLSDTLQRDGTTTLDIAISEDPGRYLCGYIYYCSLLNLDGRSLFVHIPPFDQTHTPQLITRLIRQLIAEVVKQITTTTSNITTSPPFSPSMLSSLMINNGMTVSFPLARRA